MENKNLKISLQSRMIAVQLKQARQRVGKPIEECAAFLSISSHEYENYENGILSPSLPELEAISYFLDKPLKLFLETKLTDEATISPEKVKTVVKIRTKIIATTLLSMRKENQLSIEEVVDKTGIPSEELIDYESGEKKIPYVQFDILCKLYGLKPFDFISQDNLIGELNSQKEAFKNFMALPEELRAFISKPINQPYLELAKKLSATDVAKLRSLAENLLEITL